MTPRTFDHDADRMAAVAYPLGDDPLAVALHRNDIGCQWVPADFRSVAFGFQCHALHAVAAAELRKAFKP